MANDDTAKVLEWLATATCAWCRATGEGFILDDVVRYSAPLTFTSTCRACERIARVFGPGMRVIERGATEATRAPPRWA